MELGIAFALVTWLVWRGGWQKILSCVSQVSLPWFCLAVLFYLAGQSLCAWKWSVLARSQGFRRPLLFYWFNYLGAMFPSLFLPTSVGGDVFRAVALAAGGGDRVGATVSVLADRGTGVLAMAWIATLATALSPSFRIPPFMEQVVYGVCAVLTIGFFAPFFVRPAFTRRGFIGRVAQCWDHPRLLLTSLGAAFMFQGLLGVIYVLLGNALGLQVETHFYFLLAPTVSLAAMSPVTINGLGERMAALVLLFPIVGVKQDAALAFGFTWTGMTALASLFGGCLLLVDTMQGRSSTAGDALPEYSSGNDLHAVSRSS